MLHDNELTAGRGRPRMSAAIGLAVAVGATLAGSLYLLAAKPVAATDNAYVKADQVVVSARVRGLVVQVAAQPDQPVAAGAKLAIISAEEYDARLAIAQADKALAQASLNAASAGLDRFESDAQSAPAPSSAAVVGSPAPASSSRSAQGRMLTAAVEQARATLAKADAGVRLATQDRAHTVIVAPIAGVVGDLQVHAGELVQPGSQILTLVSDIRPYVVANFKETQIARMRVDQPAQVTVDALPGIQLTGRVESLAPSSAAEVALLPFEPGSGNFTKIVQRIPVRIRLDPNPKLAALRSGLSARVSVRLTD